MTTLNSKRSNILPTPFTRTAANFDFTATPGQVFKLYSTNYFNYPLKSIMIVDDEADVTYTLQKMLGQDGHKVEVFNDPRQALEYFDKTLFDLVLLDIRMPHMDGFHLFKEFRKKNVKANIWFMTAYQVYRDQFGQLTDSKSLHFIEKPVDIVSLRELIRKI